MKICIAQSLSIKGDIPQNIQNHLRHIRQAIQAQADLIVFPELSITGYEPELAAQLACEKDDVRFHPFQELADAHTVTIGIGMPTRSVEGVHISMIFFRPEQERLLYSKHILHEDELPYFVRGKKEAFVLEMEKRIAFGICYETLQRSHFIKAVENKADIFIASVAKPDRGTQKAYLHFPSVAKEFRIPILMANCVGYCDNFLSNGNSALWNNAGTMEAQLDDQHQGLLMYDTEREVVAVL